MGQVFIIHYCIFVENKTRRIKKVIAKGQIEFKIEVVNKIKDEILVFRSQNKIKKAYAVLIFEIYN